jgi:hypothetical protein
MLYNYIFLGIVSPVIYLTLSRMPVEKVPRWIADAYGYIIWPRSRRRQHQQHHHLMDAEEIMTAQNLHISVMITFGIFSPILSAAVLLAMLAEFLTWKVLLGRFVCVALEGEVISAKDMDNEQYMMKKSISSSSSGSIASDCTTSTSTSTSTPITATASASVTVSQQQHQQEEEQYAVSGLAPQEKRPISSGDISKLELCCKDSWRCPHNSIWIIIISSSIFNLLVLIDMATDKSSIAIGLVWLPVVFILFPVLLWRVLKRYKHQLFSGIRYLIAKYKRKGEEERMGSISLAEYPAHLRSNAPVLSEPDVSMNPLSPPLPLAMASDTIRTSSTV